MRKEPQRSRYPTSMDIFFPVAAALLTNLASLIFVFSSTPSLCTAHIPIYPLCFSLTFIPHLLHQQVVSSPRLSQSPILHYTYTKQMTQPSTAGLPCFDKGHIKVGLDRDDKKPVKLYYEKTGEGPIKLLLITGLGTPASGWDPVVEYFSKRPEYTIVAFDNRGAGYSDAPYGLYSTSQMAQDALELLDALGWHSDVNVAGISMGGMISLELILAAPKRFSSLVLTSTNAGRSPPQLVTLAFFARVLTILDPHLRLRFITDHLYPKTWLNEPAPPDTGFKTNRDFVAVTLKKQYIDIPMQPLHANIAQVWAALTHHVSPQRLTQIRASQISVLIVTGTDDRLVRHSASKYMQKHLGCRMSVFEGSGHIIPSEQTVAYCSLVEELICESRGGSGLLQS